MHRWFASANSRVAGPARLAAVVAPRRNKEAETITLTHNNQVPDLAELGVDIPVDQVREIRPSITALRQGQDVAVCAIVRARHCGSGGTCRTSLSAVQ
jgi:hypothetical protein